MAQEKINAPDVSIVIVNYNTRDMLSACLRSIRELNEADIETVVVDNASSDGSAEMVRRDFPDAVLIENSVNRGYAGANNAGMRAAQGRNFLVLNSDTLVEKGAIRGMLDLFDKYPDTGMAGCKMTFPDGSFQATCMLFPTHRSAFYSLFPFITRFGYFSKYRQSRLVLMREYRDGLECDFISGACMMVPRSVVESAGRMDDGFHLFFEETDWAKRIKGAGWKTRYAEGGRIIHFGGQSTSQIPVRSSRHYIRSLVRYFKKHHRGSEAEFVRVSALFWLGLRIFAYLSSAGYRRAARERVETYAALFFELLG